MPKERCKTCGHVTKCICDECGYIAKSDNAFVEIGGKLLCRDCLRKAYP